MNSIQFVAILAIAPAVQGAISTLRARLNGRPGPPLLQPYRNLAKLWKKEALLPHGVSAIAAAAPGVLLGVAVTVALLVPPIFNGRSRLADAVAIVLTLALGRFVLVLASLDTGSSFEGMAASREMTFASLTEAPLLLALISPVLGDGVYGGALAGGALLLVSLAETARIPVDNQETHYELTMIHEGMILEFSGWHLALLQYASYVRQLAIFALIAAVLPGGGFMAIGWIAFVTVAMPAIERALAKMRLFEVPSLFAAATILALASIAVHLMSASA